MATKAKSKTTAYTRLLRAKKSSCGGRGTAASLDKARKAYISNAVKKGKKESEAVKIANSVVKGRCGARINGKKKTKK